MTLTSSQALFQNDDNVSRHYLRGMRDCDGLLYDVALNACVKPWDVDRWMVWLNGVDVYCFEDGHAHCLNVEGYGNSLVEAVIKVNRFLEDNSHKIRFFPRSKLLSNDARVVPISRLRPR